MSSWRGKNQTWQSIETVNDTQKAVIADIFANRHRWLFLWGKTGTGKTHVANCIFKEVLAMRKEANIVSNFELLRGVLSDFTGEESLLDYYKSLDCLVIEECEKFWQTSKGNEINILFEIINHFYEQRKQIIMISNVSWGEYLKKIGTQYAEMLTDRFSEMGKSYEFPWDSYRPKLKQEAQK